MERSVLILSVIVILVVLAVAIAYLWYHFFQQKKAPSPRPETSAVPVVASSPTTVSDSKQISFTYVLSGSSDASGYDASGSGTGTGSGAGAGTSSGAGAGTSSGAGTGTGTSSIAGSSTSGVRFHRLCFYNGRSVVLRPGRYNQAELRAMDMDEYIGSMVVPSGLVATLYQDANFKGRAVQVTQDTRCLARYGFDNRASSIIVSRVGDASVPVVPPVPEVKAMFYKRCGYKGAITELEVGDYDAVALGNRVGSISSVDVPPGLKVILYAHPRPEGRGLTVTGKIECLKDIPGNWNDRTLSIRVAPSNPALLPSDPVDAGIGPGAGFGTGRGFGT